MQVEAEWVNEQVFKGQGKRTHYQEVLRIGGNERNLQ